MNKHLSFFLAITLSAAGAHGQITITAADMPVSGDTLRYSAANAVGASLLNLTNTGANKTWDYTSLKAVAQDVQHYQSAAQVSPAYVLTVGPTAYGYKVADSIPGLGAALPVSVSDIYSFFEKKTNPSRFVADAFAAKISSLPIAANYSDDDELFFFPLTYMRHDSSTFKFSFSFMGLGTISEQGNRITTADGWGTIKTPFYTGGASCLRTRSVITEVDSVSFGGQSFGIPRTSVEYKWLVNGQHYPALWITTTLLGTTETPNSVTYRDSVRYFPTGITQVSNVQKIEVFPNPATGSGVRLSIPQGWNNYTVALYDVQGKLLQWAKNTANIPIVALPSGQYLIRVESTAGMGFAHFVKE